MEIENEEIKKGVQRQEVQVTQWLDCSLWAKYEEQIHDMEDQLNDMRQEMLRAEGLIEDLKVDLVLARQQRDENFQMFQLVEKRAIKMERKILNFRQCTYGQVIHFDHGCAHWQNASAISLCSVCKDEGTMLEIDETT